jgi:hypothetical protein
MAAGAAADVALHIGGILTTIGAFGSLVALQLTSKTPDNLVSSSPPPGTKG